MPQARKQKSVSKHTSLKGFKTTRFEPWMIEGKSNNGAVLLNRLSKEFMELVRKERKLKLNENVVYKLGILNPGDPLRILRFDYSKKTSHPTHIFNAQTGNLIAVFAERKKKIKHKRENN